MEKDLAIMFADLSGYTALTEVHGALSAADLIDRFMQIVADSLAGDSRLHERTGDEVMIVSTVPDDLLLTALLLLKNTSNEKNFLLLHGGLHFGSLVERNSSYFGSALNLTSRIARKASPGGFWCSKAFIDSLSSSTICQFESRGIHSFKNVADKSELFALVVDQSIFQAIDPVCKMLIQINDEAIRHPVYPGIFFCSENCLEIYNSTGNN